MNKRMLILGPAVMLAVLMAMAIAAQPEEDTKEESWQKLLGSWQVTSAQTSLILSIEPNRQVLVLWIHPGSHSMLRTSWKPFHGGILVQSMPRIRLWSGRADSHTELRAELEAVTEIDFDPNKEFHDHFFMKRIEYREMPPQWLDRPVPREWMEETLGDEWNASAGRRPLPRNRKAEAEQENTPDAK